jgi:CheY-like chemotaxis protein
MDVLAVDDDNFSRDLLKMLISKAGHNVVSAENGTEALRILSAGYVKIAVVDWILPDISGIDVCRRVRRIDFKIPPYIIIATASMNKKDNIIESLRAGSNDYVEKPLNAEELIARLKVAEKFISLQLDLQDRITELEKALDEINTLRGILPICMQCGKIRTDRKGWEKMEEYLSKHTNVKFSHSLCPECIDQKYSGILNATQAAKN